MLYEKLKELFNTDFKRYCGVKRKTFDKMCEIVRHKSAAQRFVSGRPAKLVVEDQVLLTLEYLREYRTMFHIAKKLFENSFWLEPKQHQTHHRYLNKGFAGFSQPLIIF